MNHEDRIVAAIERNTEQVKHLTTSSNGRNGLLLVSIFAFCLYTGCPPCAKSAPLVSDGDEIASVGTEVRQ